MCSEYVSDATFVMQEFCISLNIIIYVSIAEFISKIYCYIYRSLNMLGTLLILCVLFADIFFYNLNNSWSIKHLIYWVNFLSRNVSDLWRYLLITSSSSTYEKYRTQYFLVMQFVPLILMFDKYCIISAADIDRWFTYTVPTVYPDWRYAYQFQWSKFYITKLCAFENDIK